MVRMLLASFVLFAACSKHESKPPEAEQIVPVPAPTGTAGSPVMRGALRRANVETYYRVAVAIGADVDALEKLAHEKGPKLTVTRSTIADDFDDEMLGVMTDGLDKADVDGLKASPAVLVLYGSGPNGVALARETATVASQLADAAHGWVVDVATVKIYPAAAFHEHIPTEHPDIRDLIVVHSVAGENEQPFLDTEGMGRYGFPELYVPEAASGELTQLGHLINGAAQTLLDGGDVNERGELAIDFKKLGWDVGIIEGGTGKAVWKLRWAKDHDADDMVVELVPPGGEGTVGASRLIQECFGSKPDTVTALKDDDPELLAAAAHARSDLARMQPQFAKGIPFQEMLTVKAKFTGDEGQVEWMWVDVVSFKGNVISGTLANVPELIDSLHNGQKVKVKIADVGDYLHQKKSGARAGGYSIELMKKRGLLPADDSD